MFMVKQRAVCLGPVGFSLNLFGIYAFTVSYTVLIKCNTAFTNSK